MWLIGEGALQRRMRAVPCRLLDSGDGVGMLRRVKRNAFLGAALLTTAFGCAHTPTGRFQYEEIASQSEGRPMRYGVLLPSGWNGKTPLPIVLLLHGAGDDETGADRAGVVEALDGAIADGTLPPFIMVTPNGDRGFWVNWYDGTHRYRD